MNPNDGIKPVKIGNKLVGPGQPCFVIAEAGINHQGQLSIAKELVDVAVLCKADAIKFQKRNAPLMLTKAALAAPYTGPHSFGATYGEHRKMLELSDADFKELKKYCDSRGIMFFASGWDESSIDFLDSLDVPCFKVPSADLICLPLLEHTAKKGKPIILSTGMATLQEVEEAVMHVKKWNNQIILMQCTSTYPSKFEELNLSVIDLYKEKFKIPVGYSGHELGIAVTLAAVVIGAQCVERHFTLDRTMKGGDHAASLEMDGLRRLVRDIRAFEIAKGKPEKHVWESEIPIRKKLAKSLVAKVTIPKGTVIKKSMLTYKSPGDGLPPKYYYNLEGKKALVDIEADTTIKEGMVEL